MRDKKICIYDLRKVNLSFLMFFFSFEMCKIIRNLVTYNLFTTLMWVVAKYELLSNHLHVKV